MTTTSKPATQPSARPRWSGCRTCWTPCRRRWSPWTSACWTAIWWACCCSPRPCRRTSGCAPSWTARAELPPALQTEPILALCKRRHQQLNRAIVERQWFDPWVFELGDEDEDEDADLDSDPSEALLPWVAGFALATEIFPELMRQEANQLLEPLAAIYRHLDPDDLEDADDLLEEIESLEPPADLEEAVEALVSACLMLADITRPQAQAPRPAAARPGSGRRTPPRHGGGGRGPRQH